MKRGNQYPQQKQPGGARTKSKGVGSQTCVVKSSRTVPVGTANAGGILYIGTPLDPKNTSVVTSPVASISSAYEFYRIRSCTVEYVPGGGFTANGNFQWCFVNNPELMLAAVGGTDSQKSDIITNEQNVSMGSVAAPASKTYQNNRIKSRTWYSVNAGLSGTIDDYDRSVATVFAMRAAHANGATSIPGSLTFHITYEFAGLGTTGNNTLLALGGPRFAYDATAGWPTDVVLYDRSLGDRTYTIPPDGTGEDGADPPQT